MRERRYLVLAVLIGALVLINLPGPVSRRIKAAFREANLPFQDVATNIRDRAVDAFAVLLAPRDRIAQKEELERQVAILRERIRELEGLTQENARLREELGFVEKSAFDLILCEVIARDAAGWWETVRVNKGFKDGLSEGLAVITADGLAGRTTTNISAHTCDVLLITDRGCKVSARFSRTGAFGVVRGNGMTRSKKDAISSEPALAPCRMDYVMRDADMQVGDEVVSSGLGEIFPEGLLVGRVTSTEVHRSGLYCTAYVTPASDLHRLRYVFVVQHRQEQNGKARMYGPRTNRERGVNHAGARTTGVHVEP